MDPKNIKMRVVFSSKKPKMQTFATALGEAFKCPVDAVPPAFPCDKERIVVLLMTAGNDPVAIVENADGITVTVDVPEKATAEVTYDLTATITDEAGNSVSATFTHKVPPYAVMSYAEYAAAADDTSLVVSGVISGIFSKTNGSSGNGMYIQDVNGEGGYYVYGFADGKDPEADLGLKVDMTVIVTGVKDTYNGLYELINASVEIVGS